MKFNPFQNFISIKEQKIRKKSNRNLFHKENIFELKLRFVYFLNNEKL